MHIIANLSIRYRCASLHFICQRVLRPLDSSKVALRSEMGTAFEMTVNRRNKHIQNLRPKIGHSDRTCSHDLPLLVIWIVMVIK